MDTREGHSQYRCDIYGQIGHNKKKLVNIENVCVKLDYDMSTYYCLSFNFNLFFYNIYFLILNYILYFIGTLG